MKHYYKLFLLAILFPFLSKAQSNYKPGYVVQLNGDTLKGYIDYREWDVNPKQFSFKKVADGDAETFNVNNCVAWSINGHEHYQKFIVSVSQDKVHLGDLSTGVDTTRLIDTVFLNLITQGKYLNLYRLFDSKDHFYVSEKGGNPFELIRHLFMDPNDNEVITQATYRNQLQQLAFTYQPDNESLKLKISRVDYSLDIRPIINAINGPGNYSVSEAANTGGAVFFAGISAVNNQTKFTGQSDFGSSATKLFPAVDLGIDLLRNKNIGSLLIRLELNFTGNQAKFTETTPGVTTVPNVSHLSFDQYIGSLNPQLLYNFYNTQSLKVYIALGFSLNYATYANKVSNTTFGGESTVDNTGSNSPNLQSFFFGLTGNAGITIGDHLDIRLGYNPPANINENSYYNVKLSQYALGINYLFGKKQTKTK